MQDLVRDLEAPRVGRIALQQPVQRLGRLGPRPGCRQQERLPAQQGGRRRLESARRRRSGGAPQRLRSLPLETGEIAAQGEQVVGVRRQQRLPGALLLVRFAGGDRQGGYVVQGHRVPRRRLQEPLELPRRPFRSRVHECLGESPPGLRVLRSDAQRPAERIRRPRCVPRDALQPGELVEHRPRGCALGGLAQRLDRRLQLAQLLPAQRDRLVVGSCLEVTVPLAQSARQIAAILRDPRQPAVRLRVLGPRFEEAAEQAPRFVQTLLAAPRLGQDEQEVRSGGRGDSGETRLQERARALVVVRAPQDERLPRVRLVTRRIDRQRCLVLRQCARGLPGAPQRVRQQNPDLVSVRRQITRLAVGGDGIMHLPLPPRLITPLHQLFHPRFLRGPRRRRPVRTLLRPDRRRSRADRGDQQRTHDEGMSGRSHGATKVRWQPTSVNPSRG